MYKTTPPFGHPFAFEGELSAIFNIPLQREGVARSAGVVSIRYTFNMNKISLKLVLSALAFCLLVVACGNKGALVKPEEQTTKSEAEVKQ